MIQFVSDIGHYDLVLNLAARQSFGRVAEIGFENPGEQLDVRA